MQHIKVAKIEIKFIQHIRSHAIKDHQINYSAQYIITATIIFSM